MDYQKAYDRLISKRKRLRRSEAKALLGYVERHHIQPRCLGGSNSQSNLVYLSGREHFVAHRLLLKMNPGNSGLTYALIRMQKNCKSSKTFEVCRLLVSKIQSEHQKAKVRNGRYISPTQGSNLSQEHRSKISASLMGHAGVVHTEETKKKISDRSKLPRPDMKGRKPWNYGLKGTYTSNRGPLSEETKAKISATKRAKYASLRTT